MHNFKGESGLSYNYNSDFSGLIIITDEGGVDFHIPATELLEFVAECYVKAQRISTLESMDWRNVLDIEAD